MLADIYCIYILIMQDDCVRVQDDCMINIQDVCMEVINIQDDCMGEINIQTNGMIVTRNYYEH